MRSQLRLLLVLTRPAVAVLLAVYASIGAAAAASVGYLRLSAVCVVVLGFLILSVCANDVADRAIDRVNLPGDPRRPLVVGTASARDMVVIGVVAGVCALGAAAALGPAVLLTTAVGTLVSLAYSARPIRLADRGAVAALVLPACYVAVPYLVGFFANGGEPGAIDDVQLAGLYVAFLGRILLKDFRDVRGDALFGKRTFLVRHGRKATCVTSGLLLLLGTVLIEYSLGWRGAPLAVIYTVGVAGCVALLRAIADDPHPRRDERRISVIAIIGRGMLVTLLAQLLAWHRGLGLLTDLAVLAWLAAITASQAVTMLRHGPRARLTTAALPGADAAAVHQDVSLAVGRWTSGLSRQCADRRHS